MNIAIIIALITITLYTFGFAITLWKEKQKVSSLAVCFLALTIMVLPFFSIL